jgi:hypothetical protein
VLAPACDAGQAQPAGDEHPGGRRKRHHRGVHCGGDELAVVSEVAVPVEEFERAGGGGNAVESGADDEVVAATDLAESKARNLRAMAERRAGDAERERQAARDAVAWSVGQAVVSILYGPATVLKVNAKTIRLRLDRTGGTITEDKARCK